MSRAKLRACPRARWLNQRLLEATVSPGNPLDLPYGGIYLQRLSSAACCASQARSALTRTMEALGFPQPTIDDGALAISELATNAHLHTHPERPPTGPELWIWARTRPTHDLLVAVFDTCRDALPAPSPSHVLDEQGRGLGIVATLARTWGCHPSRSRLNPTPTPGKATWFTLPLPAHWPTPQQPIPPALAAQRLALTLQSRGLDCARRSDDTGISVVTVEDLIVWVKRASFSWRSDTRTYASHPLIDLQEAAESVVRTLEQTALPYSI
ncbi:ATP-binding protein [Spirillospora sp. NPDC029432]|uniref:ATP-binding protein n=1 Tax=Spirillospora sp. NPDC029432 TaxID=3154599 RepID=UPI0034541992